MLVSSMSMAASYISSLSVASIQCKFANIRKVVIVRGDVMSSEAM